MTLLQVADVVPTWPETLDTLLTIGLVLSVWTGVLAYPAWVVLTHFMDRRYATVKETESKIKGEREESAKDVASVEKDIDEVGKKVNRIQDDVSRLAQGLHDTNSAVQQLATHREEDRRYTERHLVKPIEAFTEAIAKQGQQLSHHSEILKEIRKEIKR